MEKYSGFGIITLLLFVNFMNWENNADDFVEPFKNTRSWMVYTDFCDLLGIKASQSGYIECKSLGIKGFLNINSEKVGVQFVVDNQSTFLFAPNDKVELVKEFLRKARFSEFLVIPFQSPKFEGYGTDRPAGLSRGSVSAAFRLTR